jgi:hypothetical protein
MPATPTKPRPRNATYIRPTLLRAFAALVTIHARGRKAVTLRELGRELGTSPSPSVPHFLCQELVELGLAEHCGPKRSVGIVPRYRFIPIDRLEEDRGE